MSVRSKLARGGVVVLGPYTSSTLGPCSWSPGGDWLTARWADRDKNKHCHRLCHSLPAAAAHRPALSPPASAQTPSPNTLSTSRFLFPPLAVMRTTVLAVVMVMCVAGTHADVRPQRDFNLQRVRWTHAHTHRHTDMNVV